MNEDTIEEPLVEAPEQEETTPAAEPAPQYLTAADLDARLEAFAQRMAPQKPVQREEAPEVDPYDGTSILQHMDRQLQATRQQMATEVNGLFGGLVQATVISQATQGLGKEEAAYVRSIVSRMPAAQAALLAQDPNQLEFIQNAAIGHVAKNQTKAPRSEGVQNRSTGLDSDAEKEIAQFQNAFGVTREEATSAYKRALAANSGARN